MHAIPIFTILIHLGCIEDKIWNENFETPCIIYKRLNNGYAHWEKFLWKNVTSKDVFKKERGYMINYICNSTKVYLQLVKHYHRLNRG